MPHTLHVAYGQFGDNSALLQVIFQHVSDDNDAFCTQTQGTDRPEPREISLALMSSPYLKALNEKRTSKILTAVGQYAAVDITNRRSMPAVSSESRGVAQWQQRLHSRVCCI